MLTDDERRLLLAIQDGLPVIAEPYKAVAAAIGTTEERVLTLLRSLLKRGIVRRLGAVPNHLALGFAANGMAVWDVPDGRVSDAGRSVGSAAEISHCYQRPRRLPEWRYNLYAMVHGHTRDEVLRVVQRITAEAGISACPHEVLFSVRQFRKRGARLQT